MRLTFLFVFIFMPFYLQGRACEGSECPSAFMPTNGTYVLISDFGDTPAVVSNRISHLPFLSDRQIADAWKLYSAPFYDECPHNAMIRFDKDKQCFHYTANFLALPDFSLFSGVPLGGLSIFTATHIRDIAGPDYSPLELLCLDFTSISNLDAVAEANNLAKIVISESPISSLGFLDDKCHLEFIQLCGIPIKRTQSIERAISNHSAKASNLYINISYTLINDVENLKKAAQFKDNVFFHWDENCLPDGAPFINIDKWNDTHP